MRKLEQNDHATSPVTHTHQVNMQVRVEGEWWPVKTYLWINVDACGVHVITHMSCYMYML